MISDPSPQEWNDLASTTAGANVAREALTLRETFPIRTFLARAFGIHTVERAWRIGAKGEQLVAGQLANLGPRWHVLHSIVIGDKGTDLDHLVIGPGGVYSINTKNHPSKKVWVGGNTPMVSGQRQQYVSASRSEAKKVSVILTKGCGFPVTATGVVVIVNSALNIKKQPDDVHVESRRRIARWLSEQPTHLSDGEINSIFEVARRSTTWVHNQGR